MKEKINRLIKSNIEEDRKIGLILLANSINIKDYTLKGRRFLYLEDYKTGFGYKKWQETAVTAIVKDTFMINIGRDHLVLSHKGSKHYKDMLDCNGKNIEIL